MTRRNLFTTLFLGLAALSTVSAQEASGTTTQMSGGIYSPKDKWELGLRVGVLAYTGDVPSNPGVAIGGHLRKSLDHVFSLRGSVMAGKTTGDDSPKSLREFESTYANAMGEAVITLNNLRFNKPYRKVNLYVLGGAGLNYFKTDYKGVFDNPGSVNGTGTEKSNVNLTIDGGGGIAYRLNSKMNVCLETRTFIGTGKAGDYLDGDANNEFKLTSYRDLSHFFCLGINFNLGKAGQSEPLYWVNPMAGFMSDIAELKARPVYDPTDTDGDGIIDAVDQEKESPAGARVDTRGVTMDSDSDGVADFKDKEPYSPPGYKVDGMGIAQIPKEPKITEADVNRIVDGKLAGFKPPVQQQGLVDWFLPMIHFDFDRYDIRKTDYVQLQQVAQVMKANPNIRVAVSGHTDKTSGDRYNNVLSYNRAKAAIDFLVANHGVSRDRLVLTYGGEATNIVPTSSRSLINRRVEFKVATTETELGRPEGPRAGKSYKGNKDAGY